MLKDLGKQCLLEKVGQVRDATAERLGSSWSHAQFEAQRTRTEQLLADGQYPAAYRAATALLQQTRAAGALSYDVADYDLALACLLLARVLESTGNAVSALSLLIEARQGFDAIIGARNSKAAARMVSVCLTEQGDCLSALGCLDKAVTAYEEAIYYDEQRGDERDVAVGKGQLGTVYLLQHLYPQALAAHEQARDLFTKLKEWGNVAGAWHQIGIIHHEAGQPEAAEVAFQEAYRLGSAAGQARTLGQLGNLYDDALNHPVQATQFYRQAADICHQPGNKADEGRQMNNLAETLRKLHRYDEARDAIQQAITCFAEFGHTTEPWKTWQILTNIETDCGNWEAASNAKHQAIAAYLAYRRDGGENHNTEGRIAQAVRQTLSTDGTTAAIALLEGYLADPKWQNFHTYLNALIAVLNGNRDPSLADATDLHYGMAAEILLLIES